MVPPFAHVRLQGRDVVRAASGRPTPRCTVEVRQETRTGVADPIIVLRLGE